MRTMHYQSINKGSKDSTINRIKKPSGEHVYFCLRSSAFGPLAVVWSYIEGHASISRVLITGSRGSIHKQLQAAYTNAEQSSCSEIDMTADRIEAFLSGEDIRFTIDLLRFDLCSDFQQKVLRAEHRIPRGSISTYKKLAEIIGNPGGVRAVGSALSNNPFPIIIPCHRVIRTDGTLGGYQGGCEMKKTLLEMEGIRFDSNGRVVFF
ncbi:MAG: MGMT family protein [Deltaproteobacteria bacterium]|nr:MGMT family protein [Deltaproteobacteria bacterium]